MSISLFFRITVNISRNKKIAANFLINKMKNNNRVKINNLLNERRYGDALLLLEKGIKGERITMSYVEICFVRMAL